MKQTPLKRKTPLRAKHPMRLTRKKTATTPEKEFMRRVAALGCLVHRRAGGHVITVVLHHMRTGYGRGQRASNWEVIPLFPRLHKDGGFGVAFHDGPREWQKKHGTEIQLLKHVYELLEIPFEDLPRLRGSEPPWWPSYLNGSYLRPTEEL